MGDDVVASKYENEVGTRFEWVNRFLVVISNVDRSCYEACGMKTTQSRILFHIALFPNKPIGNVASTLALKPSTTTAALDALESKGLATRSHNVGDRRNVCVDLTKEGLQLVGSLIPLMKNSLDEMTKDVDTTKFEELLSYIAGTNPKPSSVYQNAFDDLLKRISETEFQVDTDSMSDFFNLRFQAFENICTYQSKLGIIDRQFGVTPNEARILRTVGYYGAPVSIKKITKRISIRPNVATVSIYGLMDKGLINRDVNQKDRRSASISLTKAGKKLLNEAILTYNQLFDTCFPELSDYSIASFHGEQLEEL